MELVLWRWSTAVQVSSAVMIAVFFLVLSRTVRPVETRPLAWAWLANLLALTVTVVYWFAQPTHPLWVTSTEAVYMVSKTLFVALLISGTLGLFRPGSSSRRLVRRAIPPIVIAGVVAALLVDTVAELGTAQSTMVALGCGLGAVLAARRGPAGSAWLVVGFSTRAALATVEALAYGSQAVATDVSSSSEVSMFLAAHSSLDTGAEWLIALGCVLAIHHTVRRELIRSNEDLLLAQEVLYGLVDRDPLTGLANRRAAPGVLRGVWAVGATILFFDLDDFKDVNDRLGHRAGDQVLVRFASALRHAFRPADHVLRYAGDEFVVVAPGAQPEQVMSRLEDLQTRLDEGPGPRIAFTVGHAYLPPEGDPEKALDAADKAMYEAKRAKVQRGKPARRVRAVGED